MEALAREVTDLQQRFNCLLEEGDPEQSLEMLVQLTRAVKKLRSYVLDSSIVVSDDPAVKKLLSSIDLGEDVDDPARLGQELLYSWFNPAEYAASLIEAKVLITPFHVPAELREFIEEARQCYALGQHAAVQSLSRTVLEAAVNDVGVRTGKLPREAVERDMFREYPPKKRIFSVGGDLAGQIYDHYTNLCRVVHGLSTSAKDGSLGSLTKTISFVQLLYERNKEEIRKRGTSG